MIKMSEQNPKTDALAISSFEGLIGRRLPKTYRDFLLELNGGRPEFPMFPIKGFANNPLGGLNDLYGLGVQQPATDLLEEYERFRGRTPDGILLFGRTDTGDYLCLDLRKDTDRVAFWDHRHHWGTGEWRESDLYHVADSFEEFLAALKPNPY